MMTDDGFYSWLKVNLFKFSHHNIRVCVSHKFATLEVIKAVGI